MISGGFSTLAGGLVPPIKRSQLEYPTENVTLAYLAAIGKVTAVLDARDLGISPQEAFGYVTVDFFADKAVQALGYSYYGGLIARRVDINNFYALELDAGYPGNDFYIRKRVGGAISRIAAEAVNLADKTWYGVKISVLGSTFKIYRDDMNTPRVTASDTSIASGAFGVRGSDIYMMATSGLAAVLLPPSSLAPRPIAYFEVPVIGSGTSEDPFRAQLPEQIQGGVNLLALSHAALIKSGSDGKPVDYTAIVRIFDQSDRDPGLAPISKALDALRAIQGVRQLTRDQAIARAKAIDDKLTDLDLLSASELRKDPRAAAREYKQWRVFNLGVREELIDDVLVERYADEDKGW